MQNWKKLFQGKHWLLIILAVFIFFNQFFLFGKIPIPADTIVGMYHPWRDVTWDNLSAGVPFKNFLITDPVRQQYVWRELTVNQLKNGKLPLWNPYSFSGTPLLAGFQGAPFYPLNILFFILPFHLAWGILVVLQPLLAGLFLYAYLRFMNVSKSGSILGALSFSFSGFSIAWLEWNTILHTALWLPLILLFTEKIIQNFCTFAVKTPPRCPQDSSDGGGISDNLHLGGVPSGHHPRWFLGKVQNFSQTQGVFWSFAFIFSLASSFFAGHLQIFFYSFLVIIGYAIIRVLSLQKNKLKVILLFVICFLLFTLITSIQWLPTLQFILLSARDFDQGSWLKPGWFIPWQNLVQFIVPDFFGNPATGNYWGIWNYGEFIGFVGIIPLILALYALIFRRDKKTIFWGVLIVVSLIFAMPTPLAKLPYQLQIPLISTSQPTRLMFVIDFTLSILAALGFDKLLNDKSLKRNLYILLPVGIILYIIWMIVLFPQIFGLLNLKENLKVGTRNLILPSILFVVSSFVLLFSSMVKKQSLFTSMIYIIVAIVVFDLFRFSWKFTPFVKAEWIFPTTKIIELLKQDKDNFRIMSFDRRIMPPNFSVYYRLQDVSGYDPLYLKNYSQIIASWERDKPDLSPAAFNRIITPANFESFFTDLLGVKYILSLDPVQSDKLRLVASEGKTLLYQNMRVFPRAFFAEETIKAVNSKEIIEEMFGLSNNFRRIAVVTDNLGLIPQKISPDEEVKIIEYNDDLVKLDTHSSISRLLVLTDIYYPAWKVYIDGSKAQLIQVDLIFRGVVVPPGNHIVEFKIDFI